MQKRADFRLKMPPSEGTACAWTRSTTPAHAGRHLETTLNDDKQFAAHGVGRPFGTMLDNAERTPNG
uniref:Uncharacterized protein n=1 Tax=Mycena chlorophos TaxID=658473 RepID=A0ABQ0L7R6_MYCCL|nr:predicted protein [Mycena chlorophos]